MYRRFLTLPAIVISIFLAIAAWVFSYQFEGVQRLATALLGFILGSAALYRIRPEVFLGKPKYPSWVNNYFVNLADTRSRFFLKDSHYRLVLPVSQRKLRKAHSASRILSFDVEEFRHDGTWGPVERYSFAPWRLVEVGGTVTVSDLVFSVRVDRTGMGIMVVNA